MPSSGPHRQYMHIHQFKHIIFLKKNLETFQQVSDCLQYITSMKSQLYINTTILPDENFHPS